MATRSFGRRGAPARFASPVGRTAMAAAVPIEPDRETAPPSVDIHGMIGERNLLADVPFLTAGLILFLLIVFTVERRLAFDVGRDGALTGPNCCLYVDAVRRFPGIDWQASGGVRDAGDLWALRDGGVAAAISGRALLEGRLPAEELKPFLPAA